MGCCFPTENIIITDRPYYSLDLSIKTWARETHGLFDYDNTFVDEQFLRINNTCFIANDQETRVDGVAPKDALLEKLKVLFSCTFKNGQFWIYHCRDFDEEDRIKNPIDQVWMSIRDATPQMFPKKYHKSLGYKLTEGDIIKFGRVRFKVK